MGYFKILFEKPGVSVLPEREITDMQDESFCQDYFYQNKENSIIINEDTELLFSRLLGNSVNQKSNIGKLKIKLKYKIKHNI